MIDPAYGMPLVNWQQTGSFVVPAPVPPADPGSAPLVCIPPINKQYIPYLLGCLDQLCNPSSYDTTDPAAIILAVERAITLKSIVAHASEGACMTYQLRVDSCQLQSSTDGVTWTEVPGWESILSTCVPQSVVNNNTTITQDLLANPPNPNSITSAQMACNIADYVAEQVLKSAVDTLKTQISEAGTVIDFVTALAVGAKVFAFELPYTTLALVGLSALFNWGVSQGTTLLGTLLSDPVLWADIRCAIYSAIHTDGKITAANWAAAASNIGAISYTVPGVATALGDYAASVSLSTVLEWQQLAALNSTADCDACGGWCYTFIGASINSPAWVVIPGDTNPDTPVYQVIGSDLASKTYGMAHTQELHGQQSFTSTVITSITIDYTCPHTAGVGSRIVSYAAGSSHALNGGAGSFSDTFSPGGACNYFFFVLDSANPPDESRNLVTSVTFRGTGSCPFGTSNC